MNLSQRIEAFTRLGDAIRSLSDDEIDSLSLRAQGKNNWFTFNNIRQALLGCVYMLDKEKLTQWTSTYTLDPSQPKKIGVVMAGNIPLVGFHDFLSVLISGHHLYSKLSSQDPYLLPYLADKLIAIEPTFRDRIHYPELLKEVDAVIATGSDNTSRYFEYYFSKVPNIIRKNRSSIIVLTGEETDDELRKMGKDIFSYFGLGCRNISKVFVPEGYKFNRLYENLEGYEEVRNHHKYVNNYDYNKSIFLVNIVPHFDNGFLLIRESKEMVSPISVLFYEEYKDLNSLNNSLDANADKIQCIVSSEETLKDSIAPGKAQEPELWDYADGVDTLAFLSKL
ncbi:acyl-CoA reductase [Roseivirga sp. BDSF3-8]|uniref:acyl-CoA reductase n=1 Tax=Roseivirga sp. BDSF3-8 TaxID=3241598 RepID=UPI0035321B54